MRTAEHMEHRNLERKWRPSFSLGPHLTEGRSNDERTEMFCVTKTLVPSDFPSALLSSDYASRYLGAARLQCPRCLKYNRPFKPVAFIKNERFFFWGRNHLNGWVFGCVRGIHRNRLQHIVGGQFTVLS